MTGNEPGCCIEKCTSWEVRQYEILLASEMFTKPLYLCREHVKALKRKGVTVVVYS